MPRREAGMRRPVVLAIVLFLMSATRPAAAETLRCGSVLIQEGAEASYVLAKCGDPTSKQIVREPVYSAEGYATGEIAETQVWRYYRGPGQFPAILKIADGVVQSIEFEKHYGQPSAEPSH
jgi:Protein of unknown function (DUF2845)